MSEHTLSTLHSFYTNHFYEFFLMHDLYEARSDLLPSLIRLITSNSKKRQQLKVKLSIPETPLVQILEDNISIAETSNVKVKPDMILTTDETIIGAIEIELSLPNSAQQEQLVDYYDHI